jgi:hypothetical protein
MLDPQHPRHAKEEVMVTPHPLAAAAVEARAEELRARATQHRLIRPALDFGLLADLYWKRRRTVRRFARWRTG